MSVKRILPIISIISGLLLLTGCGEDYTLNLTAAEQAAIASYSADMLLKYDRNHQSSLVDTYVQRELNARVDTIKELNRKKAELMSEEEKNNKDSSKKDGKGDAVKTSPYAASGEQDLAKFLGQDGFKISYRNFEVTDSYPNDSSVDSFFAMDATLGKQLIVFHFDVTNTTAEEKNCKILTKDPIFRVVVNESDRKNALTTLLLNDLATVDEIIPAGESMDAVVVLETEKGYEAGFEDLRLLTKLGDEQSIIELK